MAAKHLAFQYEDSVEISTGLWYCATKHLWWKDGTVYCERSARHNGLVGAGADLRDIIKRQRE